MIRNPIRLSWILTVIASTLLSSGYAAWAQTPLTDCDRLAANSTDKRKHPSAPGVPFKQVRENINAALSACADAVKSFQNELRFQYQYARALQIRDKKGAFTLFLKIAENGYPAAYDNVGWIQISENNDYEAAIRAFQKGYELGDADCAVSLFEMIEREKWKPENEKQVRITLLEKAAAANHAGAVVALPIERAKQGAVPSDSTAAAPTPAAVLSTTSPASDLPPCQGSNQAYWTNCFGTLTYDNGDKYAGEFRDGAFSGQGTYSYTKGDVYIGKFHRGNFHGQGVYTYASGKRAVGEFRNGKFSGYQRECVIARQTTAPGERYLAPRGSLVTGWETLRDDDKSRYYDKTDLKEAGNKLGIPFLIDVNYEYSDQKIVFFGGITYNPLNPAQSIEKLGTDPKLEDCRLFDDLFSEVARLRKERAAKKAIEKAEREADTAAKRKLTADYRQRDKTLLEQVANYSSFGKEDGGSGDTACPTECFVQIDHCVVALEVSRRVVIDFRKFNQTAFRISTYVVQGYGDAPAFNAGAFAVSNNGWTNYNYDNGLTVMTSDSLPNANASAFFSLSLPNRDRLSKAWGFAFKECPGKKSPF